MSTKVQRQQAVMRLVAQHEVANQAQLVDLLAAEGITATQATVSRDLDELGAVKVRVAGGATVYAIPEFVPDRLAPLAPFAGQAKESRSAAEESVRTLAIELGSRA